MDVLAGTKRWAVVEGDCVDALRALPSASVAHVITDPPYDARTHANAATQARITRESSGVAFASLASPADLSGDLLRVSARWVVAFCAVEQVGEYARGAGDAWVRAGVWDKINPAPQISGDRPGQAVEAIAIMHRCGRKRWNRGGGAGIWRCMAPRGDDRPDHPTPKPVALMEQIIRDFTDEGDVVLDPFAGSGTTGVAALRLGRRVILIEREPRWAALCRERLSAEAGRRARVSCDMGQPSLWGDA